MDYQAVVPAPPRVAPSYSDQQAVLRRASGPSTTVLARTRSISAAEVPVLPSLTVQLYGYIAPGWLVKEFLPVILERAEDDTFAASDNVFYVYGTGDTMDEAFHDYVVSLMDYYQLLEANVVSGDVPGQDLFNSLRKYVTRHVG